MEVCIENYKGVLRDFGGVLEKSEERIKAPFFNL